MGYRRARALVVGAGGLVAVPLPVAGHCRFRQFSDACPGRIAIGDRQVRDKCQPREWLLDRLVSESRDVGGVVTARPTCPMGRGRLLDQPPAGVGPGIERPRADGIVSAAAGGDQHLGQQNRPGRQSCAPFLRAETAYIWLIETVMIGWGHQFSFESARMDKGPVDIGDDHH